MASCSTSQWGNSYSPQARLTVTQQSSTATTVTLAWTLEYVTHGYVAYTNGYGRDYSVVIDGTTVASGTTNINQKATYTVASGTTTVSKGTSARNVSFSCSFYFDVTWSNVYAGTKSASGSISIGAKTSYTVAYNANGGSGAPSSQTKWHGTALTLSSTKPTRTGYTFKGWATSASGSVAYAAGASYTANAGVTLYAVWQANTWIVTYNANGGTGAPGNQTKTYGKTLTLSNTKPTRTNYNFLGWGTSASATTVAYAPGASYTGNAALTLYAIWELAYIAPTIDNFTLNRCDSSGALDDNGEYVKASFDWRCDQTIGTNNVETITIQYRNSDSDTWQTVTLTPTGISGTASEVVSASSESTFVFLVTVTDSTGGSTPATKTVAAAIYPIDFKAGGKGVGIGKPSSIDGVFDIGFQTRMDGGILQPILPAETNLDDVRIPNTYTGANLKTYNYTGLPDGITSGTFTLEVVGGGADGQVKQILTICSKDSSIVYYRFYYEGSWGGWHAQGMAFDGEFWGMKLPNENTQGFVRTTENGLIPFASGGASYLGTATWPFNYLHVNKVNGFTYGKNKVLASPDMYMAESHTVTLSEAVSAQPHGIVLVWCYYESGSVYPHWCTVDHFVPKGLVASIGTVAVDTVKPDTSLGMYKTVFVSDTKITGKAINTQAGNFGVSVSNNYWVLHKVFGV